MLTYAHVSVSPMHNYYKPIIHLTARLESLVKKIIKGKVCFPFTHLRFFLKYKVRMAAYQGKHYRIFCFIDDFQTKELILMCCVDCKKQIKNATKRNNIVNRTYKSYESLNRGIKDIDAATGMPTEDLFMEKQPSYNLAIHTEKIGQMG